MYPPTRPAPHVAFVSASLAYQDRPVVDFFRRLLWAYGIRPVTVGLDLYAANENEASMLAKGEIRKADCVVAVQTRRYHIEGVGHKPSEWSYEEPAIGFAADKPLFIFYEEGISLKGAGPSNARFGVSFNRDTLKEDRERLGAHIQRIRDDLAERKNHQLWTTLGALAAISGGAYLLWKLFGSHAAE